MQSHARSAQGLLHETWIGHKDEPPKTLKEAMERSIQQLRQRVARQKAQAPASSTKMTIKEANQLPVNLAAKKALENLNHLDYEANPEHPYVLPLMRWGLGNLGRLNGPWGQFKIELLEQVWAMYGWSPGDVMEVLGETQESEKPDTLALDLIENLYDAIKEQRPDLSLSD